MDSRRFTCRRVRVKYTGTSKLRVKITIYLDSVMVFCTLKEEVDDEDRSKRNEEVRRDDGDDEEGAADHNDHVDNK